MNYVIIYNIGFVGFQPLASYVDVFVDCNLMSSRREGNHSGIIEMLTCAYVFVSNSNIYLIHIIQ